MKTKQYNSQLIKIENKGQIQLYSWGLELDKDKMKCGIQSHQEEDSSSQVTIITCIKHIDSL